MYRHLTQEEVKKAGSIVDHITDEEIRQYLYWRWYYDVGFFIDYFLWQYKTDKKTWQKIESAPFHKDLINSLKSDQDTLVIIPRDHAKSTTSFFVMMHDICYGIEPSILLVMPKWLWLETIGKIRDEMETNETIRQVFGQLVPGRSREEANKRRTQSQLQFLNGVSIETVSMWGSIRGKRPTKIVVDDPQENKDTKNPIITDAFNNWFFSAVYNTLDPTGKCVVIGTIVWSLCLVNFIYEQGRGFKTIKHQAIVDGKIEKVNGKRTITSWTPLWKGKRAIDSLQKRLETVDYKVFMQEYMNIPFVENWSPVYDTDKLSTLDHVIHVSRDHKRGIDLYAQPNGRCYYGIDTSTWVEWWDYSTIVVRNANMDLLAQYRDRVPPHQLCEVVDTLRSMWYQGTIGIERNNSGISTIAKAQEYHRYQSVYAEESIDKITNKRTKKAWWSTNAKSKPLMIDHHAEMFHEGLATQYSEDMLNEMRYYYRDEKWSTNAIAPHHDDLIIADAIAMQMAKHNIYIKAI